MNKYTRPDSNRALLLTIDTQNDFTLPGSPAEITGTAEAVPQIQRLVETARSEGIPIVHVVRLYRADGSNVDQCRKEPIKSGAEIVRPGTDGAELVSELKPSNSVQLDANSLLDGEFQEIGSHEWMMYKPRWSAFYQTDLSGFLEARSVNTVIVCGCNFPNCPRATIYEASERDYRLVHVPDATSGTYERGLQELDNIGVSLKDTAEAIDWMTKSTKSDKHLS